MEETLVTTSTNKTFNAESAIEEIFSEYWDYECKIYSHHRTLKAVKDLFYLKETGLRYKDWDKEVKKFGSVSAWKDHYSKSNP